MHLMIRRLCLGLGAICLLILPISTVIHAQDGNTGPFDAARSFCERLTFVLQDVHEVEPWLDYFSGLRDGRSPPPAMNCPSSTVRAIVNIVGSGSVEFAEASRSGLFSFYVARAMETELTDRRLDFDGSFRYRNDIVLAGFVWLLCPGHGEQRTLCVKSNVGDFPIQFLQTSPVFCDFAAFAAEKVEWPTDREVRPLVCARNKTEKTSGSEGWLIQAAAELGG